jgi:uncharacterized membrane protein
MNNQIKELAKRVFDGSVEGLSEREHRVLHSFAKRLHISRNTNRQFDEKLTFGQRLADKVASFGGSWTFILIFGGVLVFWVILNSFILIRRGDAFDPYPYILLNLFLSMLAALQAPVIMMSQNRQAAKDRLDAAHDYEVNLKAELEILGLHEKLDELRERKWADLILMQQEQIKLLTELLAEKNRAANNSASDTANLL